DLADLALLLEAADTGAMPGARVDDHERPLVRIGFLALLGPDAHQGIVDRPFQLAPVRDHLVVERQDRRLARPVVLERLIAALPQHVPEQDLALYGIDPVVPRLIGRAAGRRRSLLWGFGRC